MKKLIPFLLLSLFSSSAVFAKSYICTSKPNHTVYIQDDTVFSCTGGLGTNMTMRKIINQGFRVVSIAVNHNQGTDWAIVIEK